MTIKAFNKARVLASRLTRFEKKFILILLVLIFILGGFRVNSFLEKYTKLIPNEGGIYSEVLVGEVKHPNPVLARSYIDKTVASLIYSGLTSVDQKGEIRPLLAESWTIPEEGKKYVFKLKKGLTWHDGLPFTAKDVEYTVRTIQDSVNQSPDHDNWKNVLINVADDSTIEFSLSEKSAPFLSATTIGIIPSHISLKDQDSKMIGTGPFKLSRTVIKKNKISEITLKKNSDYFKKTPFINDFDLKFTDSLEDAEQTIDSSQDSALSGRFYRPPTKLKGYDLFQIPTDKKLMIFVNTAKEPLNNQDSRQKTLNPDSDLKNDQKIILITDKVSQKNQKAKELTKTIKKHFPSLEILALEIGPLQERISKRDYHLLVAPLELGSDKDLYPLFHSSQRSQPGLNLANLEDKELDKLLEEARINLDKNKRDDLQKKIEEIINNQAIFKEIDQESFYWQVSIKVKGLNQMESIYVPANRFQEVEDWYIKERRVMK